MGGIWAKNMIVKDKAMMICRSSEIASQCNRIRTDAFNGMSSTVFYSISKLQSQEIPGWISDIEDSAYDINMKSIS